MKEQIEQMLTELEKAVKECNERSAKATIDKDKYLYEGAEIAYTNVINSVRREFKNLLQPDVIKSGNGKRVLKALEELTEGLLINNKPVVLLLDVRD